MFSIFHVLIIYSCINYDFCRVENQNTEEKVQAFEEKVQAFNYFSTELLIIIEHKTQEILHCVFEEVRTNLVLKNHGTRAGGRGLKKGGIH